MLGKPDPEIYRTAALRFGLDPGEVLVLEDTPPGLAAARAAGTFAVGVPARPQPGLRPGRRRPDRAVARRPGPPRSDRPRPGMMPDGQRERTPAGPNDLHPPGRHDVPLRLSPWLPYVVPMVTFLLLTSAEDWLPKEADGAAPRPIIRSTTPSRSRWSPSSAGWVGRPGRSRTLARMESLALAVGLGLLVTVLWVGLDGLYPIFGCVGSRAAFNPNTLSPAARWVSWPSGCWAWS